MKAPFPYFGGKGRAAPIIWSALGDPGCYVEPFAGSAAVLLDRPKVHGRRVETLNDADGWLVNAWRAIQLDPSGVAKHCYGPVSEIDYHARLAWLQARRDEEFVLWLEGDPEHYDAKVAGWWLYVLSCGIGDPFGPGPWHVVDGHLRKGDAGQGVKRKLPHLGNAGQGVNRGLPHLGDAGKGVNRELPHLGNAGHEARIAAYLSQLANRLERVRITCGSWERVLTPSVLGATSGGDGKTAVFLDPPYSTSHDIYAVTTKGIDAEVRAWCLRAPSNLRIVLAGFESDHDELLGHGWTVVQGGAGSSGYNVNYLDCRRERLWLSPSCLLTKQNSMFENLA